jgi:hypothetical protein
VEDRLTDLAEVTVVGLTTTLSATAILMVGYVDEIRGELASHDGRVSVEFPAGAVDHRTRVTYIPQPDSTLDETGGAALYRLRFTLGAINTHTSLALEKFDKPVQIVVDVHELEGVETGQNWYLAYQR